MTNKETSEKTDKVTHLESSVVKFAYKSDLQQEI